MPLAILFGAKRYAGYEPEAMIRFGCFFANLVLLTNPGAVSHAEKPLAKPEAVSFDVGPVPGWVKSVTAPAEGTQQQESAGSYYLLIDRQIDVERSASYWHELRKITSENGVQAGTFLSISFDPSFEKLTLHSIRLIRDGVSSDRLDRSQIKVGPSEQDPQRLAYSNYYRAQTSLEDVRVGDVIELAYTIDGANPRQRGKYSEAFTMQWTVPVGLNVLRLVYPSHRNLSFLPRNDSVPPVVSTNGGMVDWLYQATNVPGLKVEQDAPEDYNPKRQYHVSEFGSWGEVTEWARPLFQVEVSDSPVFNDQISKLKSIADPEQRVVAALRFLQDEIRYLDADFYFGLRPPTPLNETVRRRFADSKDEVLLLVELLRRTGIDAAPALVSHSDRSWVRELLPSPNVFDHAIVQVQLGPNTYWLDPMRSAQRGPLPQMYVANYGIALVLRPDTKDLTTFRAPQTSWQWKKVVENFRIWKPGMDAELDIISDYRGLSADRIRSSFQESTREEIQKSYLQFYAREFSDIKIAKPLWYEELPGQNACRVTESYIIPNIWRLSDDQERYRILLRPDDIYSALGSTISPQRRDPLSLNHPNTVVQEINVQMFEDWPFEPKAGNLENEFFRVRDEPTSRGSFLRLNYVFESRKDRVEAGEIQKFNEAVEKAKDSFDYTLTYQTPEQFQKSQRRSLNWSVAAAALCFFGTASLVAYRYFRESRLAEPIPLPAETPIILNGIGGWLILLAIGQILRPFGFIKTGIDLWSQMFNTSSWRSLTDPIEASYHLWWAPALLYELFFMITFLVFSVLLIALFFRKRAVWPRCFALFAIANLLGIILDLYFVHHIPAARQSLGASLGGLIPSAIAAAVWIPYVYRSKRVRATFRN